MRPSAAACAAVAGWFVLGWGRTVDAQLHDDSHGHGGHAHAHVGEHHVAELLRAGNQSLLWGTYRPQLYHGIRARKPDSLMTGLMWFGLNDYTSYNEIRHTCEDSDNLSSYTYTNHDGRSYAVQEIKDARMNVAIKTSFLKTEVAGEGEGGALGRGGEEWAVRIEGESMDKDKQSRTSLIYYFGLEGAGELHLESAQSPDGIEGEVSILGSSAAHGDFRIRIVDHPNTFNEIHGAHANAFKHRIGKTSFLAQKIPTESVWRMKDILGNAIVQTVNTIMKSYTPESPPDPAYLFTLPNLASRESPNVVAVQKVGVGSGVSGGGKWGFDVYFEKVEGGGPAWNHKSLSGSLFQNFMAYNARFAETFKLPAEYLTPAYIKFAQAITSNLIGGIGYFHGDSVIDRSFRHTHDDLGDDDEDDDEDGSFAPRLQGPERDSHKELLTATPSRSFFPRGFYWDEGFHLAIVGEWDNDLSLEILQSWLSLIDKNGWVGREQILGDEARSRVPAEFVTQYPSYANPPTIPMALTSFIARLKRKEETELMDAQLRMGGHAGHNHGHSENDDLAAAHLEHPEMASAYLHSIYPSLKRHYEWFRRTQRGQLREWGRKPASRVEAYRWRGRTADHVLTSGLDDYPRAVPPHSGELHLDLMSWMGFFARTMSEVAEYLGEEEDLDEYKRHEKGILANLDELHWSEEDRMYCDLSVDEDDESIHVCHAGYVSLFPLLLQLVPADSPNVKHILDLLSDPKELWSPFGIRSLSASHHLAGQGENYWRGPIWIQMNWMVLKALKEKYATEEGPWQQQAKQIYRDLRKNVIENVFKEYERTGYVWEQYDPKTGEGKRSHPFTGWTSLVILIMTETY